MNRYPRYPAYKPSGVEWLGEIPEHWGVRRVKYYGWFQYGDSLPQADREEGNFFVYGSNGPVGTHSKANTTAPCLIIGRKGSYGKVNYSDKPVFAIDTTYFIDQNSAQANIRWLYYALPLLGLDTSSQDAAVPGLSREFAHNQYLPDISQEEQQAIVAFLDEQTAVLDNLITEKRALIDLLQEKRTAVIGTAVTQGLDTAVAMKESGVDWIGRIPAHWVLRRLKFVADFYGGGTPTKDNLAYWNGEIPWVSPKDMKAETIFDTLDHVTEEAIAESSTKLINEGALLMVVRSGILRHTIPVAIAAKPMTINQDMKALILKPFINPHYLAALIRGHQEQLLTIWRKQGATVESIEHEFMVNTLIPVPPVQEQEKLVEYIQEQTGRLDELIAETEASIATLQEYRTALIAAAVTGQIDVRSML